MKSQEVLKKLLNQTLHLKLESLERKTKLHNESIDECNSIIKCFMDKPLKLEKQTSDAHLSTEVNTPKNTLANSFKGKPFENKALGLVKEQSAKELSNKQTPKATNQTVLPRSSTKGTLSKPKILLDAKIETKVPLQKDVKLLNTVIRKPVLDSKVKETKQQLNKTVLLTKAKSRPASPEKKEIKKKHSAKEEDTINPLRNSMKHDKNKSSLMSTEENIKSSRKGSLVITSHKKSLSKVNSLKTSNDHLNIQEEIKINPNDSKLPILDKIQKEELVKEISSQTKLNYEEILLGNLKLIAKFCNYSPNLRLNKKLSKQWIRNTASHMKDEIIVNEKYLTHLRETYSIDDLMNEPEPFKMSPITLELINKLEPSNEMFDAADCPNNNILTLFKCIFQTMNSKIAIKPNQEFWKDCCAYFKDPHLKENIKKSPQLFDFSEENLLKLSKTTQDKKIDDDNYSQNIVTEAMGHLLKDILNHTGLLGANKTNVSILFSFYRYKFEVLSQKISKLKAMEKSNKKR